MKRDKKQDNIMPMPLHKSDSAPKVLALTGGIGSGKSAARKMFEELGVPGIDADIVAREIHQTPNHPAIAEIAQMFPEAVTVDGTLSRGSLRKIFAVNDEANTKLKRTLKPYVMAEIEHWTRDQQAPYVVWESALMLEERIRFDRMLVIDATNDTRIARIHSRNPDWTDEQIRNILSIQLPRSSYAAKTDDIIHNDGPPEELRTQIEKLHAMYMKKWS